MLNTFSHYPNHVHMFNSLGLSEAQTSDEIQLYYKVYLLHMWHTPPQKLPHNSKPYLVTSVSFLLHLSADLTSISLHITPDHHTSPHITPHYPTSPHITPHHHTLLHITTHYLTSPHITPHHHALPHITTHYPTSPRITPHHHTLPHITTHYPTSPHITPHHHTLPHITKHYPTSPHITPHHRTLPHITTYYPTSLHSLSVESNNTKDSALSSFPCAFMEVRCKRHARVVTNTSNTPPCKPGVS